MSIKDPLNNQQVERVHHVCQYLLGLQAIPMDGRDAPVCKRCPEQEWSVIGEKPRQVQRLCFGIAKEMMEIATGTHPFWGGRFLECQSQNNIISFPVKKA